MVVEKVKKAKAGQWDRIKKKGFKMACCDCGLVHRFDFKVINSKNETELYMKGERDNRATGQLRRHRKHPKE